MSNIRQHRFFSRKTQESSAFIILRDKTTYITTTTTKPFIPKQVGVGKTTYITDKKKNHPAHPVGKIA
jgi:hypothetical protein